MKLEDRVAALIVMPSQQLNGEWERLYGTSPPSLSDDLLRMGLAYRLQEKARGGLSRAASGALKRTGKPNAAPPSLLKAGTQLVRSWNGRTIVVDVEDGGFRFEGTFYTSLSAIARAVTGTAWSGPRFFGLTGGAQHG